MTGIAALAAAAAATQKIPGTTQQQTNTATVTSGIKVVTPTIVTPQGVKVTPVTRQIGMCKRPEFGITYLPVPMNFNKIIIIKS